MKIQRTNYFCAEISLTALIAGYVAGMNGIEWAYNMASFLSLVLVAALFFMAGFFSPSEMFGHSLKTPHVWWMLIVLCVVAAAAGQWVMAFFFLLALILLRDKKRKFIESQVIEGI